MVNQLHKSYLHRHHLSKVDSSQVLISKVATDCPRFLDQTLASLMMLFIPEPLYYLQVIELPEANSAADLALSVLRISNPGILCTSVSFPHSLCRINILLSDSFSKKLQRYMYHTCCSAETLWLVQVSFAISFDDRLVASLRVAPSIILSGSALPIVGMFDIKGCG